MTENAHAKGSETFERFPDLPHLYYLTMVWFHYNRLIVPKSRQLTVTWLFVALYLWDALFHSSRLNFIQSKKEEDADSTLDRAEAIYDHLPLFMREWQPLTGGKKTYCHMRFQRNRSHLWAIPQGPDHARQYTCTGYLSDETAFQEGVDGLLAAVLKTLGERGRMTMVSSAAPSYFELLTFDKQ